MERRYCDATEIMWLMRMVTADQVILDWEYSGTPVTNDFVSDKSVIWKNVKMKMSSVTSSPCSLNVP